jgi:hypothetical protein
MAGDWVVQLSGDRWSLEGLVGWFGQERCKVSRQEDSSYYLTSPELTACAMEGEAWSVAERFLGHINSAAKVLEPGNAAVEIGALVRVEADGSRQRHVKVSIGCGTAIARARAFAVISGPDGRIEKPSGPTLAERLVLLQDREPRERGRPGGGAVEPARANPHVAEQHSRDS